MEKKKSQFGLDGTICGEHMIAVVYTLLEVTSTTQQTSPKKCTPDNILSSQSKSKHDIKRMITCRGDTPRYQSKPECHRVKDNNKLNNQVPRWEGREEFVNVRACVCGTGRTSCKKELCCAALPLECGRMRSASLSCKRPKITFHDRKGNHYTMTADTAAVIWGGTCMAAWTRPFIFFSTYISWERNLRQLFKSWICKRRTSRLHNGIKMLVKFSNRDQ